MVDNFFVVTLLLGNKSYTIGKPVYFPLNAVTFVQKSEPVWFCSHSAMNSMPEPISQVFDRVDIHPLHSQILEVVSDNTNTMNAFSETLFKSLHCWLNL